MSSEIANELKEDLDIVNSQIRQFTIEIIKFFIKNKTCKDWTMVSKELQAMDHEVGKLLDRITSCRDRNDENFEAPKEQDLQEEKAKSPRNLRVGATVNVSDENELEHQKDMSSSLENLNQKVANFHIIDRTEQLLQANKNFNVLGELSDKLKRAEEIKAKLEDETFESVHPPAEEPFNHRGPTPLETLQAISKSLSHQEQHYDEEVLAALFD